MVSVNPVIGCSENSWKALMGYIPPATRNVNDLSDFFNGGKVKKKLNQKY